MLFVNFDKGFAPLAWLHCARRAESASRPGLLSPATFCKKHGQSGSPPAADGYDDMGRLALIKECRVKGIDYKNAGKDVDALRGLLRA